MSLVLNDFVRIGNIGTDLIVSLTELANGVEVAVDLSTFSITTLEIQLRKPRGVITTLTASILNGAGTDGKIHVVDGTGVFDRRGRWQMRGVMKLVGGNVFKGSWSGFQVSE